MGSSSTSDNQELELQTELLFTIRKKTFSENEKLEILKGLVRPGADVNLVDQNDKKRNSLLHLAVKSNYQNIVAWLLEMGADTKVQNREGQMPIQLARTKNLVDMERLFSTWEQRKSEPNQISGSQLGKRLLEAAELGDETSVQQLILDGADVNYLCPRSKQRPIDSAWENGHNTFMLVLLKADSQFPQDFLSEEFQLEKNVYEDVEISDDLKTFIKERETFHESIKKSDLGAVREFLSGHQPSRFFNTKNQTALETAAACPSRDVLETLSNMSTIDENFSSELLQLASSSGMKENVEFLIQKGAADVNLQNPET